MEEKKPYYVLHFNITEETYIHLYAASQNGLGKLNQFVLCDLLFSFFWTPLFWVFLPVLRVPGREWLLYGYFLLPMILLLLFTFSRFGIRLFGKWTTKAAASRSRKQNIPFYNEILYFFYDTGFEMKTPFADTVYPYLAGASRFCETTRYFILFQDHRGQDQRIYQAHAFDKRIIPRNEWYGFRRFLEERCRLPCQRVRF